MSAKASGESPLEHIGNLLIGLSRRCNHEGESGEYCGKCGADMRVVTSYECRICSFLARPKVYPAEKTPNFCTQCGAPRFTFIKIRKKRAKK